MCFVSKTIEIVSFWIFCVTQSILAFGLWTLHTSRTQGSGVFVCNQGRNLVILVFFSLVKGVTFGFWELHTFRSIKGSTNCGILVKLSQIVRFWIFCVTHGSLAFGLWTLHTSGTQRLGADGYTLFRIV